VRKVLQENSESSKFHISECQKRHSALGVLRSSQFESVSYTKRWVGEEELKTINKGEAALLEWKELKLKNPSASFGENLACHAPTDEEYSAFHAPTGEEKRGSFWNGLWWSLFFCFKASD
jgi:hypothetical protein